MTPKKLTKERHVFSVSFTGSNESDCPNVSHVIWMQSYPKSTLIRCFWEKHPLNEKTQFQYGSRSIIDAAKCLALLVIVIRCFVGKSFYFLRVSIHPLVL